MSLKTTATVLLVVLACTLVGSGAPPDAKPAVDPLEAWVYPRSDRSTHSAFRFLSGSASDRTTLGLYSTTDPFHQVVRFYVEKSGFEPPNWSILGREFPGDKINMPGFWQQGGGERCLTILHHIRPDSASFTLLKTDPRTGEAFSVVVDRSTNDDRAFIDLIQHAGSGTPPASK